MTGHLHVPARQRVEQRDVGRCVVGASARRPVVRRTDAREDRADALVTERNLELLVRSLDQERRVRVSDGPHSLDREPTRDAEHELLADADVDHAIGMP